MNRASDWFSIGFWGAVGVGLVVFMISLAPDAMAATKNPLKPTNTPSLSISSEKPNPKISLVPNVYGGDSSTITTTTDNPTGYATTIAINSPTETCLRRPSDSTSCATASMPINTVEGTISPTGAVNPSLLNANQWGVSLETSFSADPSLDSAWFAVPNSDNPSVIESSTTATSDAGDVQPFTIGAKIDSSFPPTAAGDGYQNTIVLTATANAIPPATVTNATTDNPGNDNGANIGNFATAGLNGGDSVTITGTGLDTAYEVDIDGVAIPSANCSIDSATQITCQTPANSAGDHSVAVKTWGSLGGVTASQKITYVASPNPSITTPTADQVLPVGTTSVNLTATTNAYAACYYGDTNTPTTRMSTTFASGNAAHQQLIDGLTDGNSYTRYVRCSYPNSPPSAAASVTFRTDRLLNFQSFTTADCEAMAINEVKPLPDARGGDYEIIRLKMSPDGSNDRCWMRQNLSLEDMTLTPADSNVSTNFTIDAGSYTQGTAGAPSNSFLPTNPASRTDASMSAHLYNWATAIAYSTAQYGAGTDNTAEDVRGNAQYSICPKGWRLPIGGLNVTTNEFSLVDIHSYGGTGASRISYPSMDKWRAKGGFEAVLDGHSGNGNFYDQGKAAWFWTSTAHASSGTTGYDMALTNLGSVNPQTSNPKYVGASIRCVL